MQYGLGQDNKQTMPLHLNGGEGIVLEYAQCCYPISGDAIVGLIKEGTGLIVHRENCTQLKKIAKEESLLYLAWDIDDKMTFKVKIELQLLNKIGALALIANILSEHKINILAATTKEIMDPRLNDLELVITIRDRDHLAMLLKRLRKVPFVHRIKRL
jgi:guanosine-3',5'-bis(diphosphate) 3'-pyrophosphohydrolase